jgi:hypothetical protein
LPLQPPVDAGYSLADFSTLKIQEIIPTETSVHTRSTWHHIPEDGVFQFMRTFLWAQFWGLLTSNCRT